MDIGDGNMTLVKILPDIAKQKVEGKPLIVGVKGVKVWRQWKGKDVLTTQSAYVVLKGERGIHASRLVNALIKREGFAVVRDAELIEELKETHGSRVTWQCRWETQEYGHAVHRIVEWSDDWYITVRLGYVATCPCAAAMCAQAGEGIPHQQRAIMKVTVPWTADPLPVLVDLFLMPRAVMKREQELEWCIQASRDWNQVFAEDAARRIGEALGVAGWEEWLVEVEHFESLHEHNMVAVNRRGRFI